MRPAFAVSEMAAMIAAARYLIGFKLFFLSVFVQCHF